MHYSISLCIYRGGRGSLYAKVVVTKGIFLQTFTNKRLKLKTLNSWSRKLECIFSRPFLHLVSMWGTSPRNPSRDWDTHQIFPQLREEHWCGFGERHRERRRVRVVKFVTPVRAGALAVIDWTTKSEPQPPSPHPPPLPLTPNLPV